MVRSILTRKIIIIVVATIFFLPQSIISEASYTPPEPTWNYWLNIEFTHPVSLFNGWNATSGFRNRQIELLIDANNSDKFSAQPAHIYLGSMVSEEEIYENLERIYTYTDCCDFDIIQLLRLIYLDNRRAVMGCPQLSHSLKNQICDALGTAKYWFTEPQKDKQIFYTENHQILYHTSELLVGQLFPNSTFKNSEMTGNQHYEHALPLVLRWLDWKAQFGFAEWHSGVYFTEDIAALVNLVDFANNTEVVIKAAMMLDLMAFGFAANFFNGTYATSMGRMYDSRRIGICSESVAEAAWLMLGIGKHKSSVFNMANIALATSDHYAPPPILEAIAINATDYIEHKERNSIDFDDAALYNLSHTEKDMMLWWSMAGPLAPETIDDSLKLIEKYNLDSNLIFGPQLLIKFFRVASFFRGITLREYSELLQGITRGICLQTANIYTYRTPYYQLSGVQDHFKGTNSMQSHIWQATLDKEAFVYTNSPSAITQGFEQKWMGGWKPRATFYKNIGIIQYDSSPLPLEAKFILLFLRPVVGLYYPYIHAYFPTMTFDEWKQYDNWIFGKKGDGYISLYSYKPTWWHNDYEIRSMGLKNAFVCEMGSANEYTTFENFTTLIRQAQIQVTPQKLGYNIRYNSPSQGFVTVAWDGAMIVNGVNIEIGPYPRFDNEYCYQVFGTNTTIIHYNDTLLELDFANITRSYT